MPKKYHIETKPTLPRFTPIGKYGIVDWKEDCLGCRNCVKKRACIYDNYREEFSFIQRIQSVEYFYRCKNCLRCVQGCTKGILASAVNPEYLRLGDSYWTPEMVESTWYQAETGKIPVSGAGYRGRFSGEGFDAMWTDMSEIVRPTRDGIHGREYISTAVDIGRKLPYLTFDENKSLVSNVPPLISIPVPIIFNTLPFGDVSEKVYLSMLKAASELGTIMIIEIPPTPLWERGVGGISDALSPYIKNLMPLIDTESFDEYQEIIRNVRIAEFIYTDDVMEYVQRAKGINEEIIISIKLPLSKEADSIVEGLALSGAEVIHLYADNHGNELNGSHPRFIKDAIRSIHLRLVEREIRDAVTLIASGGIALAEHLAKIIICGADLVAVDVPILVALECRLCGNCTKGLPCPVEIHAVETEYAVNRITNLIGALHSQLLEVLGAMGLREVRRLRGEVGRAMFVEDLERETFGQIFGNSSHR